MNELSFKITISFIKFLNIFVFIQRVLVNFGITNLARERINDGWWESLTTLGNNIIDIKIMGVRTWLLTSDGEISKPLLRELCHQLTV